MDTHLVQKFTHVLCTLVYSESLQFVLRRASPMSAQLQILVVDRSTMTVRNTINTMMFEGVSKDDLNYHMLVYYRPVKAAVQNQRIGRGDEEGAFGAGYGEPGGQLPGEGQAKSGDEEVNQLINQLILFYPRGIIAIYDNILQQGGVGLGRRKVHLKEILQADYDGIMAPQILRDKLIFVSWQAALPPQGSQSKQQANAPQGPLLVSIEMEYFSSEIVQKKSMSCREVQIVRILDHLAHVQRPASASGPRASKKAPPQPDFSKFQDLKLTDFSCSIISSSLEASIGDFSSQWDIQCFLAFNNGQILQYSFRNQYRKNKVFSVQKYADTPIYKQAVSEAGLDAQLPPAGKAGPQQPKHMITCLDFLDLTVSSGSQQGSDEEDNHLGFLLLGDTQGFIYIISLSKLDGNEDQLVYMCNISQASSSDARSVIAAKWISWLDVKFAVMTSDGDLAVYDFLLSREDQLSLDQVYISKIHQQQTFEELNHTFRFCDINQLGNQSIQAFPDTVQRPGFTIDNFSLLWPSRILRKHDISGAKEPAHQAAQDKIITQMTMYQFSVSSLVYPLRINGNLGGNKIQRAPDQGNQKRGGQARDAGYQEGVFGGSVVFCAGISSNGPTFLYQMQLNEMIPEHLDDQLECPRQYENVFYIDEQSLSISAFSNITGKQQALFSIKKYVFKDLDEVSADLPRVAFTDLQVRQNFETGIMKFLVSWINPIASGTDTKYLFTWIAYDFRQGAILQDHSNEDQPKLGIYASFLVGTPSQYDGSHQVFYDNTNESIVCLDRDLSSTISGSSSLGDRNSDVGQQNAGASLQSTSKLRIYQFDPFLDSREVNLHVKVLQMYPTPLRRGKVLLYYNISENLLQFSKNKSESKYGEDDYGLYVNRKYSWKLAPDERVLDVKWIGAVEQAGKAGAGDELRSALTGSAMASEHRKQSVRVVILTHQRIYIADKNFMIVQNFSLLQQQKRLIVRSLTVVAGVTILFSTDHHLYYLTQEKGTQQMQASGIVMSFQRTDPKNREQVVGALGDRVILVSRETVSSAAQQPNAGKSFPASSQIKFVARNIQLLEPLLLGYLATLSQSKLKTELDVDLVQRACRFLDTNQISQNLPLKLSQFGLLNSQMFLNQNALQFDILPKLNAFCEISKAQAQKNEGKSNEETFYADVDTLLQFLVHLFPNKDIDTRPQIFGQHPQPEVSASALEERNDVILKLHNDQSFCLEKQILIEHLKVLKDVLAAQSSRQEASGASLLFALSLCELLSDWQLSLSILKAYDQIKGSVKRGQQGHFQRFVKALRDSNEQGKYDEILWYAQQNSQPGKQGVVEIMEHRCLSWHEKLWDIILAPGEGRQGRLSMHYQQKSAESFTQDQPIQRLNVAFGETAFLYYVLSTPIKAEANRQGGPAAPTVARPLGAVVAESMGNWLGHDNIIEQNIEIEAADGVAGGDKGQGLAQGFAENDPRDNLQQQQIQEGLDPAIDEDKDIGSDVGADDLDEAKNVLFYLRMDEGQGELINDVTDNKFQCRFTHNAEALDAVGRRSAWSDAVLDESDRPVDLEDKWGKQNQPQYSVDLGLMQDGALLCASNSGRMPSRLTNFTLEFWLRAPQGQRELTILIAGGAIEINFDAHGIMQVVVSGEEQPPSDSNKSVNHAAWTHLAIVYSHKSSLTIFLNAQLASKSSKKLNPIPAPQPFPIIQVPQAHHFQLCEITEVRMWSCCLNRGIIGENHSIPLALLYEQKRRVRVEIQKKKKGLGGGLGKPGGPGKGPSTANRFGTAVPQANQKLAALGKSKLDKGGGNQRTDLLGMAAPAFQTNAAAGSAFGPPAEEMRRPSAASLGSAVQEEAPAQSFFQFNHPEEQVDRMKPQDDKFEVVEPALYEGLMKEEAIEAKDEKAMPQIQQQEKRKSSEAVPSPQVARAGPLRVNSKMQAYRVNQQKELLALRKMKKAKRNAERAHRVLDECLGPLLADLITLDAIFDSKGPARFRMNLARLANALYPCRDELAPLADLPSALYFTLSIQKQLTSLQKRVEPKVEMPEEEDSDTEEVDEQYLEKQYKITEAAEDKVEDAEIVAVEDDAQKRYAELDDDENEELAEFEELGVALPAGERPEELHDADHLDDEKVGDAGEEGPGEQAAPDDGVFNMDQMGLLAGAAEEQEAHEFADAQDEDQLQDLLKPQEEDGPDKNQWQEPASKDQEAPERKDEAVFEAQDEANLNQKYLEDSHARDQEDKTDEREKEEAIRKEKASESADVTPPQKGEQRIPDSEQVRVPAFAADQVHDGPDDADHESTLKEGGEESEDAHDQAQGTDLQQDDPDRQNVPLMGGAEAEETEEDRLLVCFQRASLSTLFLRVVDKLQPLYSCDAAPLQVSVYSKILILRLLKLCLEANMCAGQYCTCQRIVERLEQTFRDVYFDEDEKDFVEFKELLSETKTILEEDKVKNGGVTLNYGTLAAKQMKQAGTLPAEKKAALHVQCPQCQSDLPFGIAQEKCFDCLAELTVCQHTVEQEFDEDAFVVTCGKCLGKFQRSYAVGQGLGSKYECPICQTLSPLACLP